MPFHSPSASKFIACLSLFVLSTATPAALANEDIHSIIDFESEESLSGSHTTHPAEVSRIEDASNDKSKFSARTVVSPDGGSANHFGTGFNLPSVDLSGAGEIRFWIKTDIESTFNFQAHSQSGAVVFGFSTVGKPAETWQSFTAPIQSFRKAAWSKGGEVDWSKINKIQVTAFGNGPYARHYIQIDDVVATNQGATTTHVDPESYDGPERRGGPVFPDKPEIATPAKTPPPGFRSLFDGETLTGWKANPRLPIPKYPGAPFKMPLQGKALQEARNNTGMWKVEHGAIVGGQDPPGSGRGAYLVTEEKFGDFELIMDMKPDWKTDSGFLVRTLPEGSPGMQILVDHRPQGGIGGFYGNGIAGVHAMPFAIDAEYDDQGNPIGMISAAADPAKAELNEKTRGLLQYAADVDDFLDVWKWGEWNTIKVRCEGRIPTLTTWVNGLKISVVEMSTVDWENYDAEACFDMLGREGHISLEVHNSNFNHWLGKSRWWPGAVVRWKNIFIRELDSEPAAAEIQEEKPDTLTEPESSTTEVALADTTAKGPDFSRDVRPILSGKCFKCHGPDPNTREGDLRLDDRNAAIEMEAIVAGSPDHSYLIDRVTTDDPIDIMPPKGEPLTPKEIQILRDWIEAGAHYEKHWAYVKPERPRLPVVKEDWASKVSNPIDNFVLDQLEAKGFEPSPPAEPSVLLRRLSLDLIGLPPTTEEVARFESDPSYEAYEREVDRLLSSNHFGEKWAATWLDLARYADSNGYQHDDLRTMWPYRDWVINALNDDMPFDQFTIEQLAGDLLPNPTKNQLIATGFHRNVATNFSGGSKVDEVRADILHDRVSTTGLVWLGMTMECCQCHDHKFDPVSQVDYFEMYAYFNQAIPELAMEGPGMFRKKFTGAELPYIADPGDGKRIAEIEKEIERETATLEKAKGVALAGQAEWEKKFQASGRAKSIPWRRFHWYLRGGDQHLKTTPAERSDDQKLKIEALLFYDHPATGPHEKAIDKLKKERASLIANTMVMKDSAEPNPTHLFLRGDYKSLGEQVQPGTPDILHSLDPNLPPNRLGLAQWLVSPDNPLTARVTVNRFWADIFGRGIVTTLEDFGLQSASPSHPQLLDWLALEFINEGWSMKQLIKTIVMSSTYRQTTAVSAEEITDDPANTWLARGPRFRLKAELIRDNLLAISDQLSSKVGGPPVYPPQPEGLWKEISGADVSYYPTSEGEDRNRRGVYTFLRRGNPNPMVLNFDGSNRAACVTSRDRSNTPVQALNLLNAPTYVEAAHSFASWIENVPGDEEAKAIAAFRRAVARPPSEEELTSIISLYQSNGSWFSVAQAILNLDETITKS